jgi:diguanylate cyclase (GGDEF)-like protein
VLLLRETTTRRQAEDALLRAKEDLQVANEQLARLANTDALTGLSSRRLFLQRLAEEAARARRHLQPLSVLMLDLDLFKRINDTYGHVVGDQVLVGAASAISAVKRETDIAGRIGGEEFGLILPATDLEGARSMAERLRRSIATQQHVTDDGFEFAITASLGVATFASGVRDETELLNLADAALYYAKELGRDRVCVAGGPMPS